MSDAVLKIGSIFDKQGIVDGMAEGVDGVNAGVAQMSTSFQEIQGIASAAMKKISEDTIAAAATVTDAQVRVAEATKVSNAAYAEQKNALKLLRSEHTDAALATRILAASQEKARQTTLDLKAAQAELARTPSVGAVNAANASVGALAQGASGLAGSPQARRLAAATLEDAAAQEKLREVQQQVAVSTLSEEEKQTALAVAMERAKAASLELATSQKELQEAEQRSAVEAELSSNVFIAAVQRAELAVRESTNDMRERLYATGKSLRGGLSISGLSGGFGELLGIGLAADMAGDFLEKTAEVNVELGHLSDETGIAVKQLSGLQLIVKEMGGDWDAVRTALVKMLEAQVLATQGHKEQTQAFADLGISVKELKSLSPEELLQRISAAFATHGDHATQATAAIEIFGRGGKALIPVLQEQGEQLTSNATKAAALTGVTDASREASERWTKNMADLTAEMHKFGNWAIETLPSIAGNFEVAGVAIEAIFMPIGAAVAATVKEIEGFGRVAEDVAHGNLRAIAQDMQRTTSDVRQVWKDSINEIETNWKDAVARIHSGAADGTSSSPKPTVQLPPTIVGPGGANKADQGRLRSFEQALAEEKRLHSVSIQEEYEFWNEKLSAFTKGSTEYGTVLNRLASLAEEGARRFHEAIQKLKEKPGKDSEQDSNFAKEFARGQAEMHEWLLKTEEDLTRTGERWQGYWRSVSQGEREALQANTTFEEQQLAARHAAGGLTDLAYAEQLQQIHAAAGKAELKLLTDELERLEEVAAKAPHDAVTGNLLDPKLAQQIKQLENEIAQLQAKLKQQGFGDSDRIKNEIVKPFLDAFKDINQGWLKVQRDLILGTGNIRKDFAQMGANLVVELAQNLEQMLAKMAAYEIRTQVLHALTNQAKVASDATASAESLVITQAGGLKEALIDAKGAAVKGWKAGMNLPFPEDLVMAPVLAAAGFAGAMAQFNEGGMVTEGGGMHIPILAKAGERVLSTSQTNNFERLVNNQSSSSSRVNNVRLNQRNTFNGGKASSAAATAGGIKKLVRNGKLSFAG